MKLSTKIMRFVFLVTTSSRTDIVHLVFFTILGLVFVIGCGNSKEMQKMSGFLMEYSKAVDEYSDVIGKGEHMKQDVFAFQLLLPRPYHDDHHKLLEHQTLPRFHRRHIEVRESGQPVENGSCWIPPRAARCTLTSSKALSIYRAKTGSRRPSGPSA